MLYSTPPVELALTITEKGKRKFSSTDVLTILVIAGVMVVATLPLVLNSEPITWLPIPLYQTLFMLAGCLVLAFCGATS